MPFRGIPPTRLARALTSCRNAKEVYQKLLELRALREGVDAREVLRVFLIAQREGRRLSHFDRPEALRSVDYLVDALEEAELLGEHGQELARDFEVDALRWDGDAASPS